ncbi:MAG: hypothetical protein M3512_16225 [Bacteroidota bacterium]|nr:hypothetical protein [Bacteroidota bacterium]
MYIIYSLKFNFLTKVLDIEIFSYNMTYPLLPNLARIKTLKMFKYILFFLFALVWDSYSSTVVAQGLTYEILWKEDSIGFLKAEKKPVKNFMVYTMHSDVAVKFIAKVEMTYRFENIFSNGVLVKGTATNFVNNKKKSSTVIKWDGTKYTILVDDKEVPAPKRPIKNTLTSLYYSEPIGLTEVFSERFGEFCSINEVSPHRYELTMPNGKKNYYTYKDNICLKVEVSHSLASFDFKLVKNVGDIVLN